jgi:hypothetical protein
MFVQQPQHFRLRAKERSIRNSGNVENPAYPVADRQHPAGASEFNGLQANSLCNRTGKDLRLNRECLRKNRETNHHNSDRSSYCQMVFVGGVISRPDKVLTGGKIFMPCAGPLFAIANLSTPSRARNSVARHCSYLRPCSRRFSSSMDAVPDGTPKVEFGGLL